MKTLLSTMILMMLLSTIAVLAQDVPEYEVYVLRMAEYPPEIRFRFREVGDPQLAAEIANKDMEGIPINFVYVKGPGVNLLYGPGPTVEGLGYAFGPDVTSEPIGYLDHETLLGRLGVTLDQINYAVVDHMCFDCPSGAGLLPNATVIIEKETFDHPNSLGLVMEDGTFFPFARQEDYDMLERIREEGRLKVVDGDYQIAPGIKLYHAPGHTHATNFLTVNTKDGTVIIAGASCYTYLHLRYNLVPPPFVVTDIESTLQSYDRIRKVMGTSDALLVPGHDMEVFDRFTPVDSRIVKVEAPSDLPEYEVYTFMVGMFPNGGGIFRFSEEPTEEIKAKNREDAPIIFSYVKGPGVELIYGPGPSLEAMKLYQLEAFYVDQKTLLERVGVSVEQINTVVVDHTCFDTLGGVDLFPNATVIIEKGAFDKPNPLGFFTEDGTFIKLALDEDYTKLERIKKEGRLKIVDGDYQIAPGLKMYYAPGHTYETNFLAVNTRDGTVIIAGDSVYTYLNLEYNLPAVDWVIVDPDLQLRSYARIRQVMGPSDALLVPGHDMDIFRRFPKVADRIVRVKLPLVNYENEFCMTLEPGLNMISLPLDPLEGYTARSFAEKLGATMVIKLDEKRRRFVGFTPDAPTDGFPIEGGKGYIVNVEQGKVMSFKGGAWTRLMPAVGAPGAKTDSIWAFVVSGTLTSEDEIPLDGYTVQARNLRTGAAVTEAVSPSGYFALASADLSRRNIIQVGDELEITVRNASGRIVSGVVRPVDVDDIRRACMIVTLKLSRVIPSQTMLLQNFPNPFNPETWIPYQLAEEGDVVIRIYDSQGGLVRTLDLGRRLAGLYLSKEKAAHWDGRNDSGEPVGSGVYFYQLRAGDFSSTRKMIIRK